jgi:hypothetical protein
MGHVPAVPVHDRTPADRVPTRGRLFPRTGCLRGGARRSRAHHSCRVPCSPPGSCAHDQRRLPFSQRITDASETRQSLWHLDGSGSQSFLPMPGSPHPTPPVRRSPTFRSLKTHFWIFSIALSTSFTGLLIYPEVLERERMIYFRYLYLIYMEIGR